VVAFCSDVASFFDTFIGSVIFGLCYSPEFYFSSVYLCDKARQAEGLAYADFSLLYFIFVIAICCFAG
jgi:hypothetical protein